MPIEISSNSLTEISLVFDCPKLVVVTKRIAKIPIE